MAVASGFRRVLAESQPGVILGGDDTAAALAAPFRIGGHILVEQGEQSAFECGKRILPDTLHQGRHGEAALNQHLA